MLNHRQVTGLFAATVCALGTAGAEARCVGDGQEVEWAVAAGVKIQACIHEPGLGFQSVSWGVQNLTGAKVTISFEKVYRLACGNEVRKVAHLYGVKPGESVVGGNFSGDLDLNDAFFKEDCGLREKVSSIAYQNLRVERAR